MEFRVLQIILKETPPLGAGSFIPAVFSSLENGRSFPLGFLGLQAFPEGKSGLEATYSRLVDQRYTQEPFFVNPLIGLTVSGFDLALKAGFLLWVVHG